MIKMGGLNSFEFILFVFPISLDEIDPSKAESLHREPIVSDFAVYWRR